MQRSRPVLLVAVVLASLCCSVDGLSTSFSKRRSLWDDGRKTVARREEMTQLLDERMATLKGCVVKTDQSERATSRRYTIEELEAEGALRVATRKAFAVLFEEKRRKFDDSLAQPDSNMNDSPEDAEDERIAQDVSNAVALVGGLAALAGLGLEVGVAERAELALAVATMASVAADTDQGVVGQTMRAVGKASSPVLKASAAAGKAVAEVAEKNEVGWKSRAVFELVTEAAVRKVMGVESPKRAPPPPPPPPEPEPGFFGKLFK